MKYVNRNEETVTGLIRAWHEDEEPLESKIYFNPSSQPNFAIATGSGKTTLPNPLVTTSQGSWDMEFIVNSTLFVVSEIAYHFLENTVIFWILFKSDLKSERK